MKNFLLIFAILLVNIYAKAQTIPVKRAGDDEIFTFVDEPPKFQGGNKSMYGYIYDNLKYPQKAQEQGVKGKVFLKFVVEKDGSIGEVTVLKGIGAGCDEEAIFLVKNMPKWTPGKQNGRPVRVFFVMPIIFGQNSKAIKKDLLDN